MTSPKTTRTALFEKPVPADDVVIRCVRLADAISARLSLFFADYDLTVLQYNVLRILYVRDEHGEGLPIGQVASRLLVRGPDVTRLVDRLERAGFVSRFRSPDDRRVVRVKLTHAGTDRVEEVHGPLIEHNQELLAKMSNSNLERLAKLLSLTLESIQP